MQPGKLVKVKDAFGNELLRRVVGSDELNVYICKDEEFNAAVTENREPLCIGFNRKYVLEYLEG